jgi:hypothetical protein
LKSKEAVATKQKDDKTRANAMLLSAAATMMYWLELEEALPVHHYFSNATAWRE